MPPAPPAPSPNPVAEGDRYESLDVLRGFAVLGILAMNIMAFSGPFVGYMNPATWPLPYDSGARVVYWTQHLVFDMKMMSLFSMLFGVGVMVWSAKASSPAEVPRLRWLWLRRMGWLFAIGFLHAMLLWEGDILMSYALCGLIAVWWLRRLPAWALLLASVAFLSVQVLISAANGVMTWIALSPHETPPFNMTQEQFAQMREGMAQGMQAFLSPTAEQLAQDVATRRGSWMDVFWARLGTNVFVQVFGFAMATFWRATSMMLLGMAMYRLGVFTAQRSTRFYAIMAAACYLVGVPMVLFGLFDAEAHAFEIGRLSLVSMQLNVVGSVPIALGHAAVLLLLVRSGALGAVRRALAATGRMAFTNYLAQTLICTTIFYGYGLGQYGSMTRPALAGIVVGIWALQLTWSPLWLRAFRFGPAEWAWRSLTYWKAQPFPR